VDNDDSDKIKGFVVERIGDELYRGDIETISGTNCADPSCCKFSDNETKPRALVCWTNETPADDTGEAMWIEVETDNSITTKTIVTFRTPAAGSHCDETACAQLDENRAGIFYCHINNSNDPYLKTMSADANGNSLAFGTDTGLYFTSSYSVEGLFAFQIDRDIAVCTFRENVPYSSLVVYSDDAVMYGNEYTFTASNSTPVGSKVDYDKYLMTVSDSTDSGYPKARITDLTWTRAADEMTDGDMEAADVANWTGTNATLSSESGGQSGNCMKLLENGGANPTEHWDWVASSAGDVFEVVFYVKAGDEASYDVEVYDVNTAATIVTIKENEATTEWVRQRFFFKSLDAVNNTRIILRQKCLNGAATYILFDSVVIKKITAWTPTNGTTYTIDTTSRSPNDAAFANNTVNAICLRDKIAILKISDTTIVSNTLDDTGADSPYFGIDYLGEAGQKHEMLLTTYEYLTEKVIKSRIASWQDLPTAVGYLGVHTSGGTEYLRLVATGDAEYSSLRIELDSGTVAADLVLADELWNNYPIRIYHPTHGVLAWRDDVT
jgi:hypothetical protein